MSDLWPLTLGFCSTVIKETSQTLNGLLVIDKPAGMTSHDVVNRLRKITGEKSIGHLGTLDPMATGVLPLLLGKFTRLAQYLSSAEKSYSGTIRFGFATDTYDAEGQPAGPDCFSEINPTLTLDRVRAAAARFHGEIQQMPPAYSAKKIGGKPAYKLAREGKPVELKTVRVCITSFDITALEGAEATFKMSISAGGYVRSVAHEVGQDLGFVDGLYYKPGTAIHETWGVELGRFNTLETKEWERIVRSRTILRKIPDIHGHPMYTEEQFFVYLQQFERDFVASRCRVATETRASPLFRISAISCCDASITSLRLRGAPSASSGTPAAPAGVSHVTPFDF